MLRQWRVILGDLNPPKSPKNERSTTSLWGKRQCLRYKRRVKVSTYISLPLISFDYVDRIIIWLVQQSFPLNIKHPQKLWFRREITHVWDSLECFGMGLIICLYVSFFWGVLSLISSIYVLCIHTLFIYVICYIYYTHVFDTNIVCIIHHMHIYMLIYPFWFVKKAK